MSTVLYIQKSKGLCYSTNNNRFAFGTAIALTKGGTHNSPSRTISTSGISQANGIKNQIEGKRP